MAGELNPNTDTNPFRSGIVSGKLLVQRCAACDRVAPYSARICPACRSVDLEWRQASGRGRVRCVVEVMVSYGPEIPAPYSLVSVELEEGPHIIARYTGSPESSHDGAVVRAEFVAGQLLFTSDWGLDG